MASTGQHAASLKQERLQRVATLRGVNYWPSYSRTPVENWNVGFDRAVVVRELGFARGLGFNSVRLWNSVWGYYEDPHLYLSNLRQVLDSCDLLGLAVDLVLFDSCGVDPEVGEATERSLEEAIALKDEGDPALSLISMWSDPAADVVEAPAMVQVPDRGDATAVIWEGFVPSPGYYHLNEKEWPRWEAFARAIVELVQDHPAVVLLEVMNEPFITHLGRDIDLVPIRKFYKEVHSLLLHIAPSMPLTIGSDGRNFPVYEADLAEPLDVVSLHPLTHSPERFSDDLEWGAALASESGRLALASEWGAFPGAHDAAQLKVFESELPIALESGSPWMISHLIAGYGPFALTALLYPNGAMRPAAKYIRRNLREEKS